MVNWMDTARPIKACHARVLAAAITRHLPQTGYAVAADHGMRPFEAYFNELKVTFSGESGIRGSHLDA
jgi:hypothetical protein